jgi:hypothetical protein
MPSMRESFDSWRKSPTQVMAIGLGVLLIGLSLWLGATARRTSARLAAKSAAWLQTANELATIQQQFRVPTSTESAALIAESARMGALGVPKSDKVELLGSLGRLAEACGLQRVRTLAVKAPDSTYVPPRSIVAQPVSAADYAVTLEFTGSFAGLAQFVSSLPPSVALSRVRAARNGLGTRYHVLLSVYELNGDSAG